MRTTKKAKIMGFFFWLDFIFRGSDNITAIIIYQSITKMKIEYGFIPVWLDITCMDHIVKIVQEPGKRK